LVHGSAIARSPLSRPRSLLSAARPAICALSRQQTRPRCPLSRPRSLARHHGKRINTSREGLCCSIEGPTPLSSLLSLSPAICAKNCHHLRAPALLSAICRHPWQLCPCPQIARKFMAVAPRSPLCSPPPSMAASVRAHKSRADSWQARPAPKFPPARDPPRIAHGSP
jgi:hypothetical protein